ncbi:MAG: hypothetical protein EBS89_11480, partial [Proteobacteria bacterium]|nr:hypothetical protein [Pseudomonadota bacterium]
GCNTTDPHAQRLEREVDDVLPVIEPVGVLARLVEVPPGEHIVDLTFEPLSVRIGGVASLVGLAVASGLLVVRRVVPPAPAAVRHGEEREKGA